MMYQAPKYLPASDATFMVGAARTRGRTLLGSHPAADTNPTCDPKLMLPKGYNPCVKCWRDTRMEGSGKVAGNRCSSNCALEETRKKSKGLNCVYSKHIWPQTCGLPPAPHTHSNQFSSTTWVSCNSVHFWHRLEFVRARRLRAQSPTTALTSEASWRLRVVRYHAGGTSEHQGLIVTLACWADAFNFWKRLQTICALGSTQPFLFWGLADSLSPTGK